MKETIVFAIEGTEDETSAWQNALYKSIQQLFEKTTLFDPRKHTLNFGREQTTALLSKKIQTEKPDFIIFVPARDATGFFTLEIIKKINQDSPKTKTIALLGDDDTHFDCFSRYVVPFIDYSLVVQHNYIKCYQKDGLGDKIFPIIVTNSELFKPLNLEKKYDVVFIGRPTQSRTKLIRFLIKNGIDIKIWGHNWLDYPEFKKHYNGPAANEEIARIINQSKINLSFSRNDLGELHYKGRVFEVAECKAFQLVEHFTGYLNFLEDNSEIVMFKDENELLNKIKYYLSNKQEREKIARNAYDKVINNYNLDIQLKKIFKTIPTQSKQFNRECPALKNKVVSLPKKVLNEDMTAIMQKIGDAKYISFFDADDEILEFKNLVQTRAINVTGKEISCCGYYVSSKSLGDYLIFRTNLGNADENNFNRALDLTQIMTSKEYFLKNIDSFKEFYVGTKKNLVNKNNTAFIDIPLFRTKKIKKKNSYKIMAEVFKGGCLFLITLQALITKKKKLFESHICKLLIIPLLNGNTFVLKHLLASLSDRRYWNRLFRNTNF